MTMKQFLAALVLGLVLVGIVTVSRTTWAQTPGVSEKGAPGLLVFTREQSLLVRTTEGRELLNLSPVVWGPNWGWTGISGSFKTEAGSAAGVFPVKLGPKAVPGRFEVRVDRLAPREFRVVVGFSMDEDADLTLAILGVEAGGALQGKGRATVKAGTTEETMDVPLGIGAMPAGLREIVFRDSAGGAYTIKSERAVRAARDGSARLILASEKIAKGEKPTVELLLSLPQDASFVSSAADAPMPGNWAEWFEWKGTGKGQAGSALDASGWLEGPAGKHGRVVRSGDKLLYNGKEAKFWGVNASYASCTPPKDQADRQAEFYARYGINAVRLHKYADGQGWAGILKNGSNDFDAAALGRMDYYVAQLKQRGIYTKLSANFGSLPLGPADYSNLSIAGDFKPGNNGWGRADQGALWFSKEIQDLQMGQLLKILEHTNPHTGLKYAEDPAVMCVEMVNENSLFFFTTMASLQEHPAVRKLAGEAFFEWLKEKYKTEEGLVKAWGPGVIGSFGAERLGDESWSAGLIFPVGNPWFFDPDNLNGSQSNRKARLLDTMQFMYDQQNRFYDRFVAEIRATGYTGEIVASNWQAGRAYSHFFNLHSDSRVGMIDRHNYFGGSGAMVAAPGGGSLSSGMQQVAGHPFMLSEWIHTFPNEYGVEGPAILGAYGMGLNGWDVSFMFQNGDEGTFRRELGPEWDIVAPQIIGVFPAVARQVYREDVKESELVFSRNVHVPSLGQGKLGFDDRVQQGYDVKEFGSDAVPAATLAIGRGVVSFTDAAVPTQTVDLTKFIRNGMVVSSTGQLAWKPGSSPQDGYFTINSPGTQAVVGFAAGVRAELADVTLAPKTSFAAVYVSAVDRDATLASGKRLLVTTIARVRNTDQKMVAGTLLSRGKGPMRVEPVTVEVTLKRAGPWTVHVLDHDGNRTGRTVPLTGSTVVLDGSKTGAVYYEIVGQ